MHSESAIYAAVFVSPVVVRRARKFSSLSLIRLCSPLQKLHLILHPAQDYDEYLRETFIKSDENSLRLYNKET